MTKNRTTAKAPAAPKPPKTPAAPKPPKAKPATGHTELSQQQVGHKDGSNG